VLHNPYSRVCARLPARRLAVETPDVPARRAQEALAASRPAVIEFVSDLAQDYRPY